MIYYSIIRQAWVDKRQMLQTASIRGSLGWSRIFFSEKLMKSLRDTDHSWVVRQFQSGPSSGAVFADVYYQRPAQNQGSAGNLWQGVLSHPCCRDRNEHHPLQKCFLLVRAACLRNGLCIETLIDQYIRYPTVNDLHWCKRVMYS